MPGLSGRAVTAGWLFGGLLAQSLAQGIFTCVDGKGRNLTADRPIVECSDRVQKELSPGGLVKRQIPPTPTALERALEEENARKALEERNRLAEEKRRDRALLVRYPDRAAHDKERQAAIAQIDEVIAAANRHTVELVAQRKRLDGELEFFAKDPSKAPPELKRSFEENERRMAAQKRFVANQEAEKQRTNARFDEEQAKLTQLWAQRAAVVPGAAAASVGLPPTVKR